MTMIQKIKAPITVLSIFNHKTGRMVPKLLRWDGKPYEIKKVGFHHSYRKGRTLYHVFSVASKELFFRIVLNTDSLNWELEEIADGFPG